MPLKETGFTKNAEWLVRICEERFKFRLEITVRQLHHCENITEHTYTNPDGIADPPAMV